MTSKFSAGNSANNAGPGNSGTADTADSKTLLGQIMVQLGYITVYQLEESLNVQRRDAASGKEHMPLGQILLEMGYCTPNQLIRGIQVQVELRKSHLAK